MKEAKRRGPLGCLIVVAGIALLLGALGVVTALAVSWYHYSNTPDFLTYLRSNPVDIGVLDERVGRGEVLAEARTWRMGETDPWQVSHEDPDLEQFSLTIDVDLEHGEETLLQLRQRFLLVLDRESGERRGFRVETPQLDTNRDMRAIVVTTIGDVDDLVGAESTGQGWAIVDVYLAAGAGKSEVRILRATEPLVPQADGLAAIGLPSHSEDAKGWEALAALLGHGLGSPPVIGLAHHVRQAVSFEWRDREGGTQGAGVFPPSHAMTTREYSYDVTIGAESKNQGSSHSQSTTYMSSYTWDDEVW